MSELSRCFFGVPWMTVTLCPWGLIGKLSPNVFIHKEKDDIDIPLKKTSFLVTFDFRVNSGKFLLSVPLIVFKACHFLSDKIRYELFFSSFFSPLYTLSLSHTLAFLCRLWDISFRNSWTDKKNNRKDLISWHQYEEFFVARISLGKRDSQPERHSSGVMRACRWFPFSLLTTSCGGLADVVNSFSPFHMVHEVYPPQ